MCDYSLQNVKSRKAQIEDKLVATQFHAGTTGFRSRLETPEEQITAICLIPGTELAFDKPIEYRTTGYLYDIGAGQKTAPFSVAVFKQINKDNPGVHHDALEFPDGTQVLLTHLVEGQTATVLQLPPVPNCAEEAEAQARLEYVG